MAEGTSPLPLPDHPRIKFTEKHTETGSCHDMGCLPERNLCLLTPFPHLSLTLQPRPCPSTGNAKQQYLIANSPVSLIILAPPFVHLDEKLPPPLACLLECLQLPLPPPASPLDTGVPETNPFSSFWQCYPLTGLLSHILTTPITDSDPAHSDNLKSQVTFSPVHFPSFNLCTLEGSHTEPLHKHFFNFLPLIFHASSSA